MKALSLGLVTLLVAYPVHAADTTVGMPAQINGLVLPGSELEVKPLEDRKTPVIVRIVRVFPHGTAFRYDLEYYALEPGSFDLKQYLRRKNRSSIGDLPAIPVTVESVLPAGQIRPHELEQQTLPWLGGYWKLVVAGGLVWLVILVVICRAGHKRLIEQRAAARPLTAADRLRPLVEGASAGKLPPARLAELERTLIVLWKDRLGLKDRKVDEAMAVLRNHPGSGPLLNQLEIWLHRPGLSGTIDVASLLEPYRNIPAETLEGAATAP